MVNVLLLVLFWIGFIQAAIVPTYGNFAVDRLLDQAIYLTTTANEEIVVTSLDATTNRHLQPLDYLTHVNGIKILSGGLAEFLRNGEKEAVIPVIDDADEKEGGNRLLGFVKLTPFTATTGAADKADIQYRRGDIVYDSSETVFVSGIGATAGGGSCLTSRDCFFHNGTCVNGACLCPESQRGAHCQVHLTTDQIVLEANMQERRRLDELEAKRKEQEEQEEAERKRQADKEESERRRKIELEEIERKQQEERAKYKAERERKEKQARQIEEERREIQKLEEEVQKENQRREEEERIRIAKAEEEALTLKRRQRQRKQEQDEETNEETKQARIDAAVASATAGSATVKTKAKVKVKTKVKAANVNDIDGKSKQQADDNEGGTAVSAEKGSGGDASDTSSSTTEAGEQPAVIVTVDDLYGPGKRYPTPFDAGRPPNMHIHDRHMRKKMGLSFSYAVRFRMGPFGFAFDNKDPNATIVERVIGRSQADQSEIQRGDRLIAANTFDTFNASAKITQRILATLEWPIVLAFETKATPADPNSILDESIRKRTKLLHLIYPPTLTTLSPAKVVVAEWTPDIVTDTDDTSPTYGDDPGGTEGGGGSNKQNKCPIFVIKTVSDVVGCQIKEAEFALTATQLELQSRGVGQTPFADAERTNPMLSMLYQKSTPAYGIELRSLAVMKRGVCTFVDKAKSLFQGHATVGLVVNNEGPNVVDMPSGKEDTGPCKVPLGMISEHDGALVQLAATNNQYEVLAILTDAEHGPSAACQQALSLSAGIIDRWPHSIPPLPTDEILQAKAPSDLRSASEEGGRMAVSGENGWVYFDYHAAMFGGSLPTGPVRLQMAFPPFGCDPAAYTVRIKGAAVAILRGGGCSFGIKVINAQKLGAVAVIIVNTDDKKTMRLMALADEAPLIKIPCVMVSRRLQYYVETQLHPYYLISQHLVAFDHTNIFGQYEERNQLALPQRIDFSSDK